MSNKANPRQFQRTMIASRGLDFASLFTMTFGRHELNGHVPMMREPPGVSTAGGKQATQHIVLARDWGGGATITIGHANVATKTCKLRTHGCLERMHQMRYRGHALPIAQELYQPFFDSVRAFMVGQGMHVEIETQPPAMPSMPPPGMPSRGGASSNWLVYLLLIFLLIAGSVVAAVVLGVLGDKL